MMFSRIIRSDECVDSLLIKARNENASITMYQHVNGVDDSQWISASDCVSASIRCAMKYTMNYAEGSFRLAIIGGHNAAVPNKFLLQQLKGRVKNYARYSKEVLFEKMVTADCIITVTLGAVTNRDIEVVTRYGFDYKTEFSNGLFIAESYGDAVHSLNFAMNRAIESLKEGDDISTVINSFSRVLYKIPENCI